MSNNKPTKKMVRRQFFFTVPVVLAKAVSPALLAGVPSNKAVYRGGTLAAVEPATAGSVAANDAEEFIFLHRKGELRIPYEHVNSLEYGQKAARRLGLAITLSPFFLLSKKRKHYLTVGYIDDEGQQQAAVFELGKKIVRTTLAALEARTGRRVDYTDEEARDGNSRP